jgi:hypothetical protein
MSEFYGVMTIPSNPILPNFCIAVERPESSVVEKLEFFSFWTRFTAGLFLPLSIADISRLPQSLTYRSAAIPSVRPVPGFAASLYGGGDWHAGLRATVRP